MATTKRRGDPNRTVASTKAVYEKRKSEKLASNAASKTPVKRKR